MKIVANCETCGTHLVGENLNQIGNRYYCQSDYSKELEKPINRQIEIENRAIRNLLQDFEELNETDFTNWNLIECSETDNVITTQSV